MTLEFKCRLDWSRHGWRIYLSGFCSEGRATGKMYIIGMWFAAAVVIKLGTTATPTGEKILPNDVSQSENTRHGDIVTNMDGEPDLVTSNPRPLYTMSPTDRDFRHEEHLVVLVGYNVVRTGEDNLDGEHSGIPLASITGPSNVDAVKLNTELLRNMYEVDDSLHDDFNQLDPNEYDDQSLHIMEIASLADDVGKDNDDKWKYMNDVGLPDGDYGGSLNFVSVDAPPNVSKTNLDEVIDFVLQLVNNNLIRRKRDQIPIPDIHKVFDKKVGSVTVQGKFNALEGYFKNVSTIRRTGDVTVEKVGASLKVECALGLGTMQVGYNHYDIQLQTKSANGTLTGTVGANSISLKATLAIIGGSCKATLDELKLEQFKDMKVEITGLGTLGDLLAEITNWITEHFQTQIVSKIEKELNKAVMDTLGRFHCDHLFSEWYRR